MIKVLVKFCVDADIIECPDWIVTDLKLYQQSFDEWLFDKKNDHPYWKYKDGEKYGCSYRSSAFVDWLNRFVLYSDSEKSSVLEECVSYETGVVCRIVYPQYIAHKAEDLKDDFINWLQTENEKGYIRKNAYINIYGENRYFAYALAEWLNQFILNKCDNQAYVIDKQIDIREIESMPIINF